MKNILLGLIIMAGLYACDNDDYLDNSGIERNYFAVPEGATDEESVLRREFYDQNEVYLLFSDTLGYREVTTLSGRKKMECELLNLSYNMSSGSGEYTFAFRPYETLAEKRAMAEFVGNDVLKNVPKLFRPYSVLLIGNMERSDEYETEELSVYSGMKAMAIACENVLELQPEEKVRLKNILVQGMVTSKLSSIPDSDFTLFYSYSQQYYGIPKNQVPTPIQSVGFLENYYYDFWKNFNSKEYDLLAYVEEIFKFSEFEFRETYAEYPIVIKKMEEVVKVLQSYGVKIYRRN